VYAAVTSNSEMVIGVGLVLIIYLFKYPWEWFHRSHHIPSLDNEIITEHCVHVKSKKTEQVQHAKMANGKPVSANCNDFLIYNLEETESTQDQTPDGDHDRDSLKYSTTYTHGRASVTVKTPEELLIDGLRAFFIYHLREHAGLTKLNENQVQYFCEAMERFCRNGTIICNEIEELGTKVISTTVVSQDGPDEKVCAPAFPSTLIRQKCHFPEEHVVSDSSISVGFPVSYDPALPSSESDQNTLSAVNALTNETDRSHFYSAHVFDRSNDVHDPRLFSHLAVPSINSNHDQNPVTQSVEMNGESTPSHPPGVHPASFDYDVRHPLYHPRHPTQSSENVHDAVSSTCCLAECDEDIMEKESSRQIVTHQLLHGLSNHRFTLTPRPRSLQSLARSVQAFDTIFLYERTAPYDLKKGRPRLINNKPKMYLAPYQRMNTGTEPDESWQKVSRWYQHVERKIRSPGRRGFDPALSSRDNSIASDRVPLHSHRSLYEFRVQHDDNQNGQLHNVEQSPGMHSVRSFDGNLGSPQSLSSHDLNIMLSKTRTVSGSPLKESNFILQSQTMFDYEMPLKNLAVTFTDPEVQFLDQDEENRTSDVHFDFDDAHPSFGYLSTPRLARQEQMRSTAGSVNGGGSTSIVNGSHVPFTDAYAELLREREVQEGCDTVLGSHPGKTPGSMDDEDCDAIPALEALPYLVPHDTPSIDNVDPNLSILYSSADIENGIVQTDSSKNNILPLPKSIAHPVCLVRRPVGDSNAGHPLIPQPPPLSLPEGFLVSVRGDDTCCIGPLPFKI